MTCLDENTLVAFLDRTLPEDERAKVTAHLDTCQACRKLVSAMASWYQPDPWQRDTDRLQATESTRFDRPASDRHGKALPEPAPGVKVDRYTLLRPLASGGMSVVFAAFDQQGDQRLAIKFLRSASRQPADDARLLREAQVMARLSHPNIVRLHDVGLYGDRVYLVMELVEGGSMRHWLSKRRPRADALRVLIAAGEGLAAAHRGGVIHRDFKPENVLVSDDGAVKVMDFGLARATEGPQIQDMASPSRPLTRPGMIMGTPGYMSPEQLKGGLADARSDQFAFCCALYEALCGERPFPGVTLEEYSASLKAATVKPLRWWISKKLRQATMQGLSIDPAGRLPSMDALLNVIGPRHRPRQSRRTPLAAAISDTGDTVRATPASGQSQATVLDTSFQPGSVSRPPPPSWGARQIAVVALATLLGAGLSVAVGSVLISGPKRSTRLAPGKGGVEVNATPPGTAFLDGQLLGPTPLSLDKVEPGIHFLKVELVSASGRSARELQVEVRPGEVSRVDVDFGRAPSPR